MRRSLYVNVCSCIAVCLIAGCGLFGRKPPLIVQPADASYQERLAAREIRRYVYLRTGTMLEVVTESPELPETRDLIVVADNKHPLVGISAKRGGFGSLLPVLDPGHCLLRTVEEKKRRVLVITSGDDTGVLYGAYRFARTLGVGFSLTGDVVPAERIEFEMPILNEDHKPQFAVRGILPWHGHPEGPDWWSLDDYQAVLAQMPKLGMNFIGFHSAAESETGHEPSVWIGRPGEVTPEGVVNAAYPARWFNTHSAADGYAVLPTGEYVFGADRLFDLDVYGPRVMDGFMPEPDSDDDAVELFTRTGAMFEEVFDTAGQLGIETCIGTETPLAIPAPVRERIEADGGDPGSLKMVQSLYKGMFEHISRTADPDCFWLWTPAEWARSSGDDSQVARTIAEIEAAIAAASAVDAPFTLAVAGRVPGPPSDRMRLDTELPREIPLGVLNQYMGYAPVDHELASITRRPTWVIPWIEDDRNLLMPQFRAGRLRADALAAKLYGGDALIGLHWRTGAAVPSLNALADAGWHQEGFEPQPSVIGPIGANVDAFTAEQTATGRAIANTDNDAVFQTVRTEVDKYRIEVPNGLCRVTLQFSELVHDAPGRRVFNVNLEGEPFLTELDIAAASGRYAALEYTYEQMPVIDGVLDIEFERIHDCPVIAGIVVETDSFVKKINCGGPAYADYDADWDRAQPRDLATGDFYLDWATIWFGPEVAVEIADVFEALDGHMPFESGFDSGYDGFYPDSRDWDEVSREYAFVDTFEQLRSSVTGEGNLARFDYWRYSFWFMRLTAQLNCFWGEFEHAMQRFEAASDDDMRTSERNVAMQTYQSMHLFAQAASNSLLASVTTSDDLGAVATFQSRILPRILGENGERLKIALGAELPDDLIPSREYTSDPRLIVPTVRTSLETGEPLALTAIVLQDRDTASVTLQWRVMGTETFTGLPFEHGARGVYRVELPAADIAGEDIEYLITATTAGGSELVFPPDGAVLPQSVVVMEP